VVARIDWPLGPAAHRGLHDRSLGRVENSASAVTAALDAGFAIEVDLQVSSDGVAMVFHDPTLDRLTSESGLVAARTADALRRIRYRDGDDTIIDLPTLLDLVDGRQALYLETKSIFDGNRALEEAIAAPLSGYTGPLAVMSFDPASILWCRENLPRIPRGLVSGAYDGSDWLEDTGDTLNGFQLRNLLDLRRVGAGFVNYDIACLEAPAPQYARQVLGFPLLTWTVRTPSEREKARELADVMVFEGFVPDCAAEQSGRS